MTTKTSQPVSIKNVTDELGNITHSEITIGKNLIPAPFNEPGSDLRDRVLDECGVELSTSEVMTVTGASRQQMEIEAARLKAVLVPMPVGTVAVVDGEMSFWIDERGELAWCQCLTLGVDDPEPHPIESVGDIDTEELWEIAESIRKWLAAPETVQTDPQWLHQSVN